VPKKRQLPPRPSIVTVVLLLLVVVVGSASVLGEPLAKHGSSPSTAHLIAFHRISCQEPLESLHARRARLRDLLVEMQEPLLAFSDGVMGEGRDFFARVVAQGHEGVMAKHLDSRYQPGKRSPAWKKIKPVQVLPCVIVGYRPGREGVRSLLVATVRAGTLCYVGQVSQGLSAQVQVELAQRLTQRRRPQPLVSCLEPACWVEPEIYCRVRFQDWTSHGQLRHAVFDGWLEGSK